MANLTDRRTGHTGPRAAANTRKFPQFGDLVRLEGDQGAGTWIDPQRAWTTVGEWTQQWRRSIVDPRPSTLARLDSTVHTHVLPKWRRVVLSGATNADVRAWAPLPPSVSRHVDEHLELFTHHADALHFTGLAGQPRRRAGFRRNGTAFAKDVTATVLTHHVSQPARRRRAFPVPRRSGSKSPEASRSPIFRCGPIGGG